MAEAGRQTEAGSCEHHLTAAINNHTIKCMNQESGGGHIHKKGICSAVPHGRGSERQGVESIISVGPYDLDIMS